MPKALTLIVNPTAGRGSAGRALPLIRNALAKRGITAETLLTSRRGEGERLAQEAIGRGENLIVAVGGDGTLHEVSNAVMDATRPNVTLGLIPFGTGNDFARCVGLFGNPDVACDVLVGGERRGIDVGIIRGEGLNGPRRFLVAAGVGFVADTAQTVNAGIRFLRGAPAYIYGALKTLQGFKPLMATITDEQGKSRSFESMLISVSNVATTGGGIKDRAGRRSRRRLAGRLYRSRNHAAGTGPSTAERRQRASCRPSRRRDGPS